MTYLPTYLPSTINTINNVHQIFSHPTFAALTRIEALNL